MQDLPPARIGLPIDCLLTARWTTAAATGSMFLDTAPAQPKCKILFFTTRSQRLLLTPRQLLSLGTSTTTTDKTLHSSI
jgi:hypothetical protein